MMLRTSLLLIDPQSRDPDENYLINQSPLVPMNTLNSFHPKVLVNRLRGPMMKLRHFPHVYVHSCVICIARVYDGADDAIRNSHDFQRVHDGDFAAGYSYFFSFLYVLHSIAIRKISIGEEKSSNIYLDTLRFKNVIFLNLILLIFIVKDF